MLPIHKQVATYGDHTIYLRKPGFEYTPVMLAKVASYIVQHETGVWSVFAFMYSLLPQTNGMPPDEDALLDTALTTIQWCIDEDQFFHRAELTFEYRKNGFVQVIAPRWWIPTAQ